MPLPSDRRFTGRPIDVPVAVLTWLVAFFAGTALSTAILAASGVDDTGDASIPVLFAGVSATWVAYLAGAWWASQRAGSGSPVADYGLRFAPMDALGIPLGVLTQLALVPLTYVPLTRLWPSTFTDDSLDKTARDLVDRASGAGLALLIVMVCVGAPLVEEIVYRGMLQRSLAGRLHQVLAVVIVAAWFALIHFRPVEFPGLFVFGLVVGASTLAVGRLGLAVVTHVAFNAAGLALAMR